MGIGIESMGYVPRGMEYKAFYYNYSRVLYFAYGFTAIRDFKDALSN